MLFARFFPKILTDVKTNFTKIELSTTFRSWDIAAKIFPLKFFFSVEKFCQGCRFEIRIKISKTYRMFLIIIVSCRTKTSTIRRLWGLLLFYRNRSKVVQVDTPEECAPLFVNFRVDNGQLPVVLISHLWRLSFAFPTFPLARLRATHFFLVQIHQGGCDILGSVRASLVCWLLSVSYFRHDFGLKESAWLGGCHLLLQNFCETLIFSLLAASQTIDVLNRFVACTF